MQAGLPQFTLVMIYDYIAPVFSRMLYNELFWDGQPSKKNTVGDNVTRETRDRTELLSTGFIMILAPIMMELMSRFFNVRQADVKQEFYELEMLPAFDET